MKITRIETREFGIRIPYSKWDKWVLLAAFLFFAVIVPLLLGFASNFDACRRLTCTPEEFQRYHAERVRKGISNP